ncbi:uncharacterized protein LOC126375722 [Pectinophora gossypiella]|uniref:uncharacterized protein LOC126375722 n=1 Tax=Pectinophora gossypiella TaxID=13191 RepID=UPI00214E59CE|nr:uncharacterized protein LOC126375722 [Pectinophora gossypiella]
MVYTFIVYFTLFCLSRKIDSLPPALCNAPFKWQDCGKPPVPVMYYWKPGSRCEVGLWKGCLPNMNMFRDEYECVSTCIFSSRAMPEDYHNFNEIDFTEAYGDLETTTVDSNDSNMTNDTNGTNITNATNSTENVTTTVASAGAGNETGDAANGSGNETTVKNDTGS